MYLRSTSEKVLWKKIVVSMLEGCAVQGNSSRTNHAIDSADCAVLAYRERLID